jgi:hypothetical protein
LGFLVQKAATLGYIFIVQFSRRRKLWLAMAAAVVVLALLILGTRWHSQRKLAAYKAELIAKGEKLSDADLVPPTAGKDQNAAFQLIGAANRLGLVKFDRFNFPSMMLFVARGHAEVGWHQKEFHLTSITNTWDDLAADLALLEADFQQIHAVLQSPPLGFGLNHSRAFLFGSHLSALKKAATWEAAAAMSHLNAGRLDEALMNLHDIIALSRSQAQKPLLVSQLVRIAVASIGLNATWEALQAPGWDETRLARLQQGWESQEFLSGMVRGLEMDRALWIMDIDRFRLSPSLMSQWMPTGGGSSATSPTPTNMVELTKIYFEKGTSRFRDTMWRWFWSYADERLYLELMQKGIEHGRAAIQHKSSKKLQQARRQIEERIEQIAPVDAVRFPVSRDIPVGSLVSLRRSLGTQTQRELTVTAIALKRFELRHGKLPSSLAALLPEFLQALPVDYMDGQPMRYRLNADGTFTLYSVGSDFKDDGGDGNVLPDRSSYSLWNCKDALWPLPATPEEIEAFHAKHRKK